MRGNIIMTKTVKTGFILSIFAHILSWGPAIYFLVNYMALKAILEGTSNSTSYLPTLNYYLLSSAGTVAIVLGIIALVNLGRRTDNPKDLPFKTAGRVLAISAFILVGLAAVIIAIGLCTFFAYLLGF